MSAATAPTVENVVLLDLIRDDRLRFRDTADPRAGDATDTYAEAMLEADGWGPFPPLLCVRLTTAHEFMTEEPDPGPIGRLRRVSRVYPVGKLVLVGGFTRCTAAVRIGEKTGPAVVLDGDWDLAFELALKENATHGRPRSPEENRRVIFAAIDATPGRDPGPERLKAMTNCTLATCKRWKKRYREELEAARAAPAPRLVADPEVVRDAWGREVPDWLADEFRGSAAVSGYAASLRKKAMALADLAGLDGKGSLRAGFAAIDPRVVMAELLQIVDRLEGLRAFIVCPACSGDGRADGRKCRECAGDGRLTRGEAVELSPEMEKAGRAAAAA